MRIHPWEFWGMVCGDLGWRGGAGVPLWNSGIPSGFTAGLGRLCLGSQRGFGGGNGIFGSSNCPKFRENPQKSQNPQRSARMGEESGDSPLLKKDQKTWISLNSIPKFSGNSQIWDRESAAPVEGENFWAENWENPFGLSGIRPDKG